jgi:hypothetical protein
MRRALRGRQSRRVMGEPDESGEIRFGIGVKAEAKLCRTDVSALMWWKTCGRIRFVEGMHWRVRARGNHTGKGLKPDGE